MLTLFTLFPFSFPLFLFRKISYKSKCLSDMGMTTIKLYWEDTNRLNLTKRMPLQLSFLFHHSSVLNVSYVLLGIILRFHKA